MSTVFGQYAQKRRSFGLRPGVQKLAVLLCVLLVLASPTQSSASSHVEGNQNAAHNPGSARQAYNDLLEATSFGQMLLYDDNLTGRIVWNEAYFMESLVNMYEVTGDLRYLDIFVDHADHVLAMRDDRTGRPDYAGRTRPGWQTDAYYTLGVPVTISDTLGNPSLEIQGVHQAGNDHTVIEISHQDSEHFTLLARNDFRRDQPLEVSFEALTLETVEATVNANLSPGSWVRVRVVGDSLPIEGTWALSETYRMVFHELHTPIIGVPFLRFADLVLRNPRLSAFHADAVTYVDSFEESLDDYLESWGEDERGGFFMFEPGGKVWASGLVAPCNGLSANGRFLLWLWLVTENPDYLARATALATTVRANMTFLPDGTMTMPYWLRDTIPYDGWQGNPDDSPNGLYAQYEPDQATEDVSHFSLTLYFMIDALQMGVAFDHDDLVAVAQTFTERLWKPPVNGSGDLCDPNWRTGFYLAHNLDGKGHAYDYAVASFALVPYERPLTPSRASQVYETRYRDIQCMDIDYLYGEVMLGWSILARVSHTKLFLPLIARL